MNPPSSRGAARLHVFIPSYQNPDLLAETLRSVLDAMEGELSAGTILATCVDDASPECLESVVSSTGKGLIAYARNERNLGIIPNFNHCIRMAQAPYCMFLGADDLILPGYWTAVASMMERFPGAAVYAPGVGEINSSGLRSRSLSALVKAAIAPRRSKHRPALLRGRELAFRLAVGDFFYFPSLCWETEALRRRPFDPVWSDAADWHRLFLGSMDGEGVVLDRQDTVFLYRRHAASASETSARRGVRFGMETRLALEMRDQAKAKGWSATALMAWLRPTVRMNAFLRWMRHRESHLARH